MLTKPLLLLTLAAFAVPGAKGQALAESTSLPFALAVGKVLFTSPRLFIEVSSTERIYISKGHGLALADTQCLGTETPSVQLCFGNRWPTRVRLLPHRQLKIGLHSPILSLLAYMLAPSSVTEPLNPVARAMVAEHLLSHPDNHKSDRTLFEEPLGEGDAEADSDPIEWWGLAQQQTPDINDSDMVQVRFDNDLLLRPGTRYCFAPGIGAQIKAYSQAAPDDSSGSADNGSSDENSDNDSDEEETETETETDSDVEYIRTTADPFPVAREIREYCASLEQRKIKQEPSSDSEIPIGSEVAVADSTHELPIDQPPPATGKKSTGKKSTGKKSTGKKSTGKKSTDSGKKPYPCKECSKIFSDRSALTKHQRTHSGEKPYLCTVCGKTFARRYTLTTHQRTHSGEKPYLCTVCGKTFARGSCLTIHQRTHSGEKPHRCKVCGKGFSDSSALVRHKLTHSGKKAYSCQQCGKAFAQNSHLKTHQVTHSGEKPYSCPQCNKVFAQRSSLNKHQRKQHKTAEESPTQRK